MFRYLQLLTLEVQPENPEPASKSFFLMVNLNAFRKTFSVYPLAHHSGLKKPR